MNYDYINWTSVTWVTNWINLRNIEKLSTSSPPSCSLCIDFRSHDHQTNVLHSGRGSFPYHQVHLVCKPARVGHKEHEKNKNKQNFRRVLTESPNVTCVISKCFLSLPSWTMRRMLERRGQQGASVSILFPMHCWYQHHS